MAGRGYGSAEGVLPEPIAITLGFIRMIAHSIESRTKMLPGEYLRMT